MKILHVIIGLNHGGAEMMLSKLLSYSDSALFDSSVLSLTGGGTLEDKIKSFHIPIYHANMKSGSLNILQSRKAVQIIKELNPDLIQAWMYHGNILATFSQLFATRKIPVIWNIRSSPYLLDYGNRKVRPIIKLNRNLSKMPKKILYNSNDSMKEHLAIGFNKHNAQVIPNGFDTAFFLPSEEARYLIREELGLDSSTFLIGMIARFDPLKDHMNFLKACHLMLQSSRKVHFLLAGRSVDWENEFLVNSINSLGIQDHIHLLGEREDIQNLAAALDILSLTSYSEGFPNVIGEAMSCGVPCVVTDAGDSGYIVDHTGIVVHCKDPDALATGWSQLYDMTEEARNRLRTQARKRIVDHFSIQSIVKQYELLYQSIISSR